MDILGHQRLGNGPQGIIMLHDWMGDHRNYEPMLPYLSRDFTLVLADLRGYGLSRSISGEYQLAEAAADVLALADALALTTFHLMGHSMSSLIVQQVAAMAPQRIQKLVLATPIHPSGMAVPEAIVEYLQQLAVDDSLRRAGIGNQWGERLSASWVDFKLQRWSECASKEAVRGYVHMFTTERLSRPPASQLPTLAVVGEHDQEPFSEMSVRAGFSEIYPRLELFVCKNSGHYPMQETPVALASAIERFLLE